MKHPTRISSTLAVGFLCISIVGTSKADERVPVLIDTDIGTDIDDAFALGLAFGSSELDVRGITAVGDDTQKRAMMLCRFLTVTGRRHTKVAAGAKPQPTRSITNQYKYYYHPDALFNRTTKPEKEPAADFLYARVKQQPGKVTLLAIGPLTNIAQLIASHEDAAALVRRVVFLESNVALDIDAARTVFASGIPLTMIPSRVCEDLVLDATSVDTVFQPGTPLTRQIETLYQMWDAENPPLGDALAVALCFQQAAVQLEDQSLTINKSGVLSVDKAKPDLRVVVAVESDEFIEWYTQRMSRLVAPHSRPSRVQPLGRMPHRVHVAEDFDTDIERFWWMSGKPETQQLPAGSRRACRSVLTHDFDDLLMVSRQMYSAVIFNPVPGPPMGKNTRLAFRYWLKGTDSIRVQIYSLSNGYHRHLVVKGLPQEEWRTAVVDMTEARRPDGTGGRLGENERIDDIQFYIDPDAEVVIDDIVLFDAAAKDEQRPFPKRIMFTGTFDTGKQGQHWPGEFEIVNNAGNFWKAARSVRSDNSEKPWLRIGLRGRRRLGDRTHVSFRHRASNGNTIQVRLVNSKTGQSQSVRVEKMTADTWAQATVAFDTRQLAMIDEIQIELEKDAVLLVDDLLLFEPEVAGGKDDASDR